MSEKRNRAERAKLREAYRAKHWRYYIRMQVRGPSYFINGKRAWPYDVIPILFRSEAAAHGYIQMRGELFFMNSGASTHKYGMKGRWKSASVEKVILK